MKIFLGRSLAARILLPCALLVTAAGASGLACATTDEVLAWEEGTDAGPTVVLDASKPPVDAATCGNGLHEDGEECDDFNVANGDGCSSTCTVEASKPPNPCPGIVFPLDASNPDKRVGSMTGDTSGQSLSFDSTTCGGGNGKDTVYAITSDVQGQAHVKIDAAFNALLYVRTACADPATEVKCKTVPVGGGLTDISFPMQANQTAYVVVDGVGGASGKYKLDVEIGTTACGDGRAQYPEQCDDGNAVGGDGCSDSCQLETPLAAPGKCPGASFTMIGNASAPVKMSFAGDISTLKSSGGAFGCGGGSGPDQVYAITPTTSGSITAELYANYAEALIHARGECFNSSTELDCRNGVAPSVPTRVTFPVIAQNTYFIFADTDDSKTTSGLYTLDVTLSAATCGNGIVETPETCDDGNTTAGDGCSDTCALEPMPTGIDTCPGAPISFVTGTDGKATFQTSGNTSLLTSGVKSCTSQTDRKDAVYSFTPPFNGWLKARAKGTFNLVLDLRTNCILEGSTTTSGSVACGDDWDGDDGETLQGAVTAGTTYYVVIDGGFSKTNMDGPYSLSMEIAPSVCGNGVIEGGETCDDGANAPGDGCGPDCIIEQPPPATGTSCTNPTDIALTEDTPGHFVASVIGGNWNLSASGAFGSPCGATAGKEAYYTVTAPRDGVLIADVDATYNITPGVRTSCPHTGASFLTCSNRSTGPGGERLALPVTKGTKYWVILDSATAKDQGRYSMELSIVEPSCGDFITNGTEECDDGNAVAGDGCSPTCTVEALTGFDTCPGHAIALTGSGVETRQTQVTVSTATLASNYSGTCGGNSRDGVIAVTSDIGGTLVAQLTSAWPAAFYARTACTDSSTEITGTGAKCTAADPAKPSDTLREVSFAVKPNVPVYLFVDGVQGASGPASLSLTVNP